MTWTDYRLPIEAIRRAGIVIEQRQSDRWTCDHAPHDPRYELHWLKNDDGISQEVAFCLECWAALRQAGVATRPGTWDHQPQEL